MTSAGESESSIAILYKSACMTHGVKKPNPQLLQYFAATQVDAIEEVNLHNNYIGNRGILAVLDVIEKLPNFRFLNVGNQKLYNTDLSDDSVKGNTTVDRIVDVLKTHPSANALDISSNPISNYAGRKLLGLCQVNQRFCRVEVANTRVDFDLRKRIAAQCEKNATLLWEQQEDPPVERPFGEGPSWQPTAKKADLTTLGAANTRRKTIVSEGIDPEKVKNYVAPHFPKSEDEMKLIMDLLTRNVLFGSLTSKDMRVVAGAMQQRQYVKNDDVMVQGSINNTLFIIQKGSCDILKEGQKVFVKSAGTAVGEIELMYDTPCVATVNVTTDTLQTWYLDRDTYTNLVMGTAIRRREIYMKHLEKVPFLQSLDSYEKLQVADALSSNEYQAGDYIISHGTDGEWLHIILEGIVEVVGRDGGEVRHVCEFTAGDMIGELEFLNNHRTVADVVAKTYVQTAKLNRRHFELCMGPVLDVLRRNTQHPKYDYYNNVLSTALKVE